MGLLFCRTLYMWIRTITVDAVVTYKFIEKLNYVRYFPCN